MTLSRELAKEDLTIKDVVTITGKPRATLDKWNKEQNKFFKVVIEGVKSIVQRSRDG